MNKPRSLRTQLLLRLTLPLAFVVMLDAAVSYFVALHYADRAYDRWLLDSARSLAQQVKGQKDKITFELPPIAVEMFRWDDMDKTFFKVESLGGGFMAGDKALSSPSIPPEERDRPYFSNGEIGGKPIRIVSVLTAPTAASGEVLVSVAETLNKRRGMMSEILFAVVLPQILLVLVTGLHIWTGVNRGLQPLRNLARIIAGRSARDLDPIPDTDVPLEVRSLTHTINELLQRLAASMATQRRFIENAAHQLRTPLAGLKIQAERALRAQDPETMRPALSHIKNSADRVAHLSDQLLVLARSEATAQDRQNFAAVNLGTLVRDCCMDWAPKALERDMELELRAPEEPIFIGGNADLLRELLNNLLDNALRYGRAGGQIAVKLDGPPRTALIVDDDGPGIEPAEAGKVFERFYRVPGSPGDGCGLGLAIVKEIADLHGARLHVSHSCFDSGTRIEVAFGRQPVEGLDRR
ncbi:MULTISPECIES: sensor histidine kinase [Methylococcus]|uniref:histidine kinase n=1 Tax=Methylococcus capsulatus TaxID=414 RepID=A0ABZ2F3F3_METCP|nr:MULTISPECIES: sensor histidine kinase [Methylococcus]MDF9392035.1 sensor histidine kinase [Methylococcus capsulatus]